MPNHDCHIAQAFRQQRLGQADQVCLSSHLLSSDTFAKEMYANGAENVVFIPRCSL